MKPDLPQTETFVKRNPRTAKHSTSATTRQREDSALQKLSLAGGHYMRSSASGISIRRRPRWTLSLLAALVAGAALTFSERFEYRCTANFQFIGEPTAQQQVFYRKELLDYAWHHLADESNPQTTSRPWFVDSPEPGKLRLCVRTLDRMGGLDRIQTLAHGYLSTMESFRKQALSTPTDGEQILSEYIINLQSRLIYAREQADTLMAKLPPDDPSRNRDALREKWKSLHKDFIQTHERLTHALYKLIQLRSEPEPTLGVVSPRKRSGLLQSDHALQQDLKELAVNLTELKLHLLNVRQQSSGPLEKLSDAVKALHHLADSTQTTAMSEDIRVQFERLAEQSKQYQDKLAPFIQAWRKEFITLRRTEINAYSDEILAAYHRARSMLNDFLYAAAKHLSDMRAAVTAIGESRSDSARYYVLQSELVRAHQTVQTAHHQFEFSAGRVETPNNFRLDAALKGARGLYRRSQHRIGIIDRHLRSKALERAKDQRKARLEEAGRWVDDVRNTADKAIEQLVSLQSELNLSTDEAEAFQRALFEAELVTGRLQSLQTHIGEMDRRLRDLEDRHAATVDVSRIELLRCDVTHRPVNLMERLRIGSIVAVITLCTVLFGQWWISRRN